MKKIGIVLILTAVLSLAAFSQSGRSTRPRIVGEKPKPQPTATPSITTETADSSADSSSETTDNTTGTIRKPPVLIGDDSTKNSPTPPVLNDSSKNNGTANASTEGEKVNEDDEVIRIETSLVMIPVSVLDRDGRFITGLQQKDFQIFEDGKQQQIEYFATLEQPFVVVLLLDVSNSTQFKIDEIQNAAISFINQLRRDDRVMVVSFAEEVRVLCEPTNNRSILQNAIRQAQFNGGTSLYDAVKFSVERLNKIEGRKAVVLFTDGVDTTSRRATYQSTVRGVEELDAMIYPIRYDTFTDMNGSNTGGTSTRSGRTSGGGILGQILGSIITGGNVKIGGGGSTGTSREAYRKGAMYLDDLARNSGGRVFQAQSYSNLETAFYGIAEELRRQYSIGYYPETVGEIGQRKQIRVKVNRVNSVVRSKNSYVVGKDTKKINFQKLAE